MKIMDLKMRCDTSQGRKSKAGGGKKSKATQEYTPLLKSCYSGDGRNNAPRLRLWYRHSIRHQVMSVVFSHTGGQGHLCRQYFIINERRKRFDYRR